MDTFDWMMVAAVLLYGYRALRPFLRRRRAAKFEQETAAMEENWRSIRSDAEPRVQLPDDSQS